MSGSTDSGEKPPSGWERRALRERAARKEAERLLESKALELWEAHERLAETNEKLEQRVQERTEALRTAVENAEAANRAKSEFLASMSHEIRTPLHAILASLDLISFVSLAEDQRENLRVVESASTSLLELVDDLLDLAKVESGKMSLQRAEFDLSELATGVIELFQPRAEAAGLKIVASIPDGPTRVLGDRARLRQVLLNLVSNAVKFTEKGEVRVVIEALNERSFHFEVSDTGPGIPAAEQAAVFERFKQVSDSEGRIRGTGLGIPLCRDLLALMGSELLLESEVGAGSRFHFDLQLDSGDPTASDTSSVDPREVSESVDLSSLRVLAVDDNAVNLTLIARMLKAEGIEAVTASGGRAALEKLATEHFDLVLLDLQMPDLDGDVVTTRVRAGEDGVLSKDVLIVALTANAMRGERERCLAVGMDGFLTKPLRQQDLRTELARWTTHLG